MTRLKKELDWPRALTCQSEPDLPFYRQRIAPKIPTRDTFRFEVAASGLPFPLRRTTTVPDPSSPAMDPAAAALGAAPAAGAPPPGAAAGEQQVAPRVERLSAGVQQQLNLEGMRTRAVGLYKAISRILEDFDVIARTNPSASPKW